MACIFKRGLQSKLLQISIIVVLFLKWKTVEEKGFISIAFRDEGSVSNLIKFSSLREDNAFIIRHFFHFTVTIF